MNKPRQKARKTDDTSRIIADMHGVSTSMVTKVRNGIRNNDHILESLIDYEQGKQKLIARVAEKTRLIKHIEKLVPIESKTTRYGKRKK